MIHQKQGNNYQKIMIFGRPGSGKSTFAYYMSQKTQIPLYHLDKYFYVSNWIERDEKEFIKIQKKLVSNDKWIIDGNSIKTLEIRWSQADLIIYFNYSKITCLLRLIKRMFLKNKNIDDRATNCHEKLRFKFLKYMWYFNNKVTKTIERLKHKYSGSTFIEISSDKDLKIIKNMICK